MIRHPAPLILLTGRPGVGKTTLVRAVASRLDPVAVSGFFSSEIRIEGRREGFQTEMAHTGEKGLLASPNIEGEPRFGTLLPDGRRRLGISLDFLDGVVCPAILNAPDSIKLFVLDEIGPMQASSSLFRFSIESLIGSGKAALASIATSEDPWISSIRDHSGGAVIEINKANRDLLTELLVLYLSEILSMRRIQHDQRATG